MERDELLKIVYPKFSFGFFLASSCTLRAKKKGVMCWILPQLSLTRGWLFQVVSLGLPPSSVGGDGTAKAGL